MYRFSTFSYLIGHARRDGKRHFLSSTGDQFGTEEYEPKLTYLLTNLFNICLKQICFPDCWKSLSLDPVVKRTYDIGC